MLRIPRNPGAAKSKKLFEFPALPPKAACWKMKRATNPAVKIRKRRIYRKLRGLW